MPYKTCVVCKGWDLGRLQQGAFDTGDTRLRVLSSPHSTSILCVSLGFAGFTSDCVFSRWKCMQAEANTTIARSSSAAGGSQGRRSVPLESIGQLLCAGLGALNILESQHVVRWSSFSQGVDGDGRWMIIVIVSETIAPLITKYIYCTCRASRIAPVDTPCFYPNSWKNA